MNEILAAFLAGAFLAGVTVFLITIAVVSRSVHEERHPAPPVVPPVRPVGGDAHNYRERS